jgi:hypothetical protein
MQIPNKADTTMKKFICILSILLMGFEVGYSMVWEMALVVNSGTRVKIWRNGVYTHNIIAGSQGKVHTGVSDSATFYLDIGNDGECQERYGPALLAGTTYTIVIGGDAVQLTTPPVDSCLGDFVITYAADTFSLININATNPQIGSTFDWTSIDVSEKFVRSWHGQCRQRRIFFRDHVWLDKREFTYAPCFRSSVFW